MGKRHQGEWMIFIAAVLWSLGGVLIKLVSWNPIRLNGARSLFAFLVFVLYRRSFRIKWNPYTIGAGACLLVVNVLNISANQLTTAANAIMLQYLAPVLVLFYLCIYEKRRPKRYETFCLALTLSGMAIFFFNGLKGSDFKGTATAILSAFFFAGVFFFNSLPEAESEDAVMIGLGTSSCLLLFGNMGGRDLITADSVALAAFMGIVQLGIPYILFAKGIKRTDPVSGSLISVCEAVLNPVWVLLFLKEKPALYTMIGGSIILFSVILNTIQKKEAG